MSAGKGPVIDDKPMEKGGAEDCSSGPVKNRGCTDIICCLAFIAHWVVFIMLFGIALGEGDPARLTSHRDFKVLLFTIYEALSFPKLLPQYE